MVYKPKIRHLGGSLFLVESRSKAGLLYKVDTLNLRCSCEAGQHFKRCWHLTYSLMYENWMLRQKDRSPV